HNPSESAIALIRKGVSNYFLRARFGAPAASASSSSSGWSSPASVSASPSAFTLSCDLSALLAILRRGEAEAMQQAVDAVRIRLALLELLA
ncbi:hypothetical protein, partial [uncultured Sphingomonas sp.]|uniref:hypothetical protein n=1 Tax=uncultured Sphingomonas sp. TaxID=158754 RepID=UPI0035CB94AA